jgi:hypothetical protein
MTALGSAAYAMHETFCAYLDAGFSEEQSLFLVGQIMRLSFEAAQAEQAEQREQG